MKTSNKLLLTLALLILGAFGAVHLTLYARLKTGHITSEHSREGWVRGYHGAAPARIIVKGNINITLNPADSTVVDIEEGAADKVRCRMAGDSLVIEGDSFLSIDPHSYYQNYGSLPWVSVDAAPRTRVRFEGQFAILHGSPQWGKARQSIEAVNSQIWVGENNAASGAFYDSLHVDEVNSFLLLHTNAAVIHLSARLGEASALDEGTGQIGTIDLQYTLTSKISLRGVTLDKLKKQP